MKERIVGAIAIIVFGFAQWILGYITGWCAAESKHLEKEVAETKKLLKNPFRKKYATLKRKDEEEVEEESAE